MVEHWKYVDTVLVPVELASAISDEWEATLKAECARIYTSLTTKIANETDFKAVIADASSTAYADFLGTTGGRWDVDEIERKQKVKLTNKYTLWKERIDEVFGGAEPTFPATVTAKKGRLTPLKRVIGAVGHKAIDGWNPVSASVLLLRGDTRVSAQVVAKMTNPENFESVLKPREGALITPSIIADLVMTSLMAMYAHEGGLTTERDAFISEANTRIDALLQFAIDAVHAGAGYDVTVVCSWSAENTGVVITVIDTHPA